MSMALDALDRILVLLADNPGDPPDLNKARIEVKNLIMRDPCRDESTQGVQLLTDTLSLLLPTGTLDRESEAQLSRFVRSLKRDIPNKNTLTQQLRPVGEAVKAKLAASAKPAPIALPVEPTTGDPARIDERITALLHMMAEDEPWLLDALTALEQYESGSEAHMEAINRLLGDVVMRGDAGRTVWRQEKQVLTETLITVARHFGESLQELGQVDGKLGELTQRIEKSDTVDDLAVLKELLVRESGAFREQASTLQGKLLESQSLVSRAKKRLNSLNQELQEQRSDGLTDPLTGLSNAFAFTAYLRQKMERLAHLQEPFVLMLLESDNYNEYSAILAEKQADRLVKAYVRQIHRELPEGARMSRLSDDRFGILVANITEKDAVGLSVNILDRLNQSRFKLGGEAILIQMSIGLIYLNQPGLDEEAVMMHAESAMYQANTDGGHQVVEVDLEED
ncbi:MAG: GGDEF domain-containing protein [Magnetococcales bacterium]|nr:GGDEF domain-containing protein [Magnetococcales bacterium]